MSAIDLDAPGKTVLMMGNEAIARGALEAGIQVAAAYPGTPSSEIIGSLADVALRTGIYVEWSVNEKVALEVAAAASMAGLRSITAMKENGFNFASDFLLTLPLMGTKGGIVLVVCDDPSAHSSSNEQDSRAFARVWDIPLLEPGSFQEAKDMTRYALELSEETKTIVIIRGVTRISHARGNVTLGALPKTRRQAKFDTSAPFQYIPVVPKHGRSHDRLAKIRERFESAPFNAYDGPDRPDLMIVTSGSGAAYTREALSLMGVEDRVGILKLGTTWPFPEGLIARHLPKAQKILFAEETDPFLESNIKEMSADLTLSLEISPRNFYGKRSGHMPATGELNTDRIINAVARILGAPYTPRDPAYARRVREIVKEHAPERVLSFCPGCPHRASLWTIKNALSLDSRDGFLTGDIGCYALARTASGFSLSKTSGAMGSGTGLACGFGKLGQFGLDQPAVSVCGDSTFFHAAIPALVNAQYSGSNFVMCILDNGATAMTGFQPHPGVGRNAMGEPGPAVDIESICRSLKIHVEVSDPFDLKRTREALNGLLEEKGVKVLILRQSCALQRLKGEKPPYRVRIDPETCLGDGCGCNRVCTRVFRCPGILWDVDAGKSKIDEVICVGCGVCADICPNSAIVREEAR